MSFTTEQLQEIALVLENESKFYREYGTKRPPGRNDTYGRRRTIIADWLVTTRTTWGLPRVFTWSSWVNKHTVEDRDQLRRYFDDRYNIPQTETNKYAGIPSLLIEDPPTTKEPPMTWKEELIAARAAGETLQMYLGDEWINEFGIDYEKEFDFTAGRDHYRIKPKEPKPAPLTWQGALKAARDRGATIQFWRNGKWDDEGTNGLREKLAFNQAPSQYRVKPGTDPLELPVHVPGCPIPIPSPEYLAEWQASQLLKENTMSKPITITTTTFVNGADISKMADSEVFGLITSEEAVIEDLKKIKAQPKKLVAEIAKREAGIAALVAYLDSKEG